MFIHGNNILSKKTDNKKYSDETSVTYLQEIEEKYLSWKDANEALKGPFQELNSEDDEVILKRVALMNEYKDFIDNQKYAEHFDSRSNLHSSVLEEFMYYLFKDLVFSFNEQALLGKSHAFKDVFFQAENYAQLVKYPSAKIETKDHDFVIGVSIEANLHSKGSREEHQIECLEIPVIAIECKTYLDKTMLEGASTAGHQLKMKNPNALYIVVSEWLKLTEKVNLKKYQVDQIYVLRKQKNTDREFRYEQSYVKNPIYADVVAHLFNFVRTHLTTSWAESSISNGLSKGFLI